MKNSSKLNQFIVVFPTFILTISLLALNNTYESRMEAVNRVIYKDILSDSKDSYASIDDIISSYKKNCLNHVKMHDRAKIERFIDIVAPVAIRNAQMTGVKVDLLMSQAAFETGWLTKPLSDKNYNWWGIKDHSKKSKKHYTTEYFTKKDLKRYKNIIVINHGKVASGKYKCTVLDSFQEYASLDEAIKAYSNKILNEYPTAAKGNTLEERAGALRRWATDETYVDKIIKTSKLYSFGALDPTIFQ